jgi:CheY-like chemotaxis protein
VVQNRLRILPLVSQETHLLSYQFLTERSARQTAPTLDSFLQEHSDGLPPRNFAKPPLMEKLLVVDDDEAIRRLIRLELCDTCEVIDAADPQQGMAVALGHKPDAILLNLRMADHSGYELLQTFTAFSHTQKIPVIIISGEGGAQTEEHCKQLGAYSYFEKPIDFDALRECLNQVAKARRFVPRAEVRVRLHVPLVLKHTDLQGNKLQRETITENVSLSGFLCTSAAELPSGTTVEVFLTNPTSTYVGKARIVHSDSKASLLRHYGFRFIEKTGPWVLN